MSRGRRGDIDTIGDDDPGLAGAAHSTGWVARRLGVAPATLRTWHRRYRIGPGGRTAGGHRRYLPEDLARLERMRTLVRSGVPTAEAARIAAAPDPPPAARTAPRRPVARSAGAARIPRRDAEVRRLTRAATALDRAAAAALLAAALRRHGVEPTWTQLVVPVLAGIGERHSRSTGCIAVEHLLTDTVRAALDTGAGTARGRSGGHPPVLLACLDQEQHSLALHAVAAALGEIGRPSLVLGALPAVELVSATRRIGPRAVFVWAQAPATARVTDLSDLPRERPPPSIVVGGPGWRDQVLPRWITRVESLTAAVAAVTPDVTTAGRACPC